MATFRFGSWFKLAELWTGPVWTRTEGSVQGSAKYVNRWPQRMLHGENHWLNMAWMWVAIPCMLDRIKTITWLLALVKIPQGVWRSTWPLVCRRRGWPGWWAAAFPPQGFFNAPMMTWDCWWRIFIFSIGGKGGSILHLPNTSYATGHGAVTWGLT